MKISLSTKQILILMVMTSSVCMASVPKSSPTLTEAIDRSKHLYVGGTFVPFTLIRYRRPGYGYVYQGSSVIGGRDLKCDLTLGETHHFHDITKYLVAPDGGPLGMEVHWISLKTRDGEKAHISYAQAMLQPLIKLYLDRSSSQDPESDKIRQVVSCAKWRTVEVAPDVSHSFCLEENTKSRFYQLTYQAGFYVDPKSHNVELNMTCRLRTHDPNEKAISVDHFNQQLNGYFVIAD